MKQILYFFFAPFLRWWMADSIAGKRIGSSRMRLYYDRSQHLGFLFQRHIRYESDLLPKVLSFIKDGDRVFEIGSNIGQYALLLSEKIGPEGKLICLEPDMDNFSFLSFNILKNRRKNIELIHKAVSDKAGVATFYKDTKTGGRMGSLIQAYTGNHYEGSTEKVDITTLPLLMKDYGIPNFVKVDVEGAEVLMFSIPGSIVKGITYMIEVREETKSQIFKYFYEEGFTVRCLETNLERIDSPEEIPGFCNLILMHEKNL